MHIWVDANNPVAYIATGYREGPSGSLYSFVHFVPTFFILLYHTKQKTIKYLTR